MPKHTPGEWARNIKPARKYNCIYAGRNTHVAYLAVEGKTDEEIEANCRLIVAAPDLLSVLSELVNGPNAKANALWDRARAVVAKAGV